MDGRAHQPRAARIGRHSPISHSMTLTEQISDHLHLPLRAVERTVQLLADGATVPFISRYRKEATGGLDEMQVESIREQHGRLKELVHRREYILETIAGQGKLTDELRRRIADCWDAAVLEDLYLPYKPKRRTRAEVARKKGLAPLADLLLTQPHTRPEQAAAAFRSAEVATTEEALQGARDIIAERVNEDERARQTVRGTYARTAVIRSHVVKGKEEEGDKYRDYFDAAEPLRRCSSHRLLAMRRGEAEGILRLSITPADDAECLERVARLFVRSGTPAAPQVEQAVADAYKRLLRPSIETEYAAASKQKADEEAIQVFTENLRQLLLTPPLGTRRIMGIDPGYRTGCKVVCLDSQGQLLCHDVIFPHPPRADRDGAAAKLRSLARRHAVEAIAIGNGTAGRETEDFVRALELPAVDVFLVSEDGASVYSASKAGREEFPDEDVTVRGAVSIGRRLADPLAELVKIDARSLGIGQYQHDVDPGALKQALDQTVTRCVNAVGVNLNTASKHLLTYVSGLGPALAQNIVDYRTAHGPFADRRALLGVPRLGAKAFEQCAGFLRIPDGDNPLDNTAVHPERYALVRRMAADAGCDVATLIASPERRRSIDLKRYCNADTGMPTLTDILDELARPGRDPRGKAQVFRFADNLHSLTDLQPGMEVPGVVTNITRFGCFVDMGIKVKGLVHVSQMADRYVADPSAVVRIQQRVRVRVLEVDAARGRVSLSLKGVTQQDA